MQIADWPVAARSGMPSSPSLSSSHELTKSTLDGIGDTGGIERFVSRDPTQTALTGPRDTA
jgi:hypothetical protein